MVHHFARLRIIHQDTLVVGTHPIIADLIFAGGCDIAQIDTLQTGETLDILVDTVLIGAYPYTTVVSPIDVSKGVIADGSLVELIVHELLPLFVLHINDHHRIVVAHQPKPVVVIDKETPNLKMRRDAFNTLGGQIV